MDETLLRILDLMEKEKISEAKMQKIIGVPRGSFSNWKRNKGRGFYQYMDVIADYLGVTIDYLIRGHEKIDETREQEEIDLVNKYRMLTPEAKKLIADNIRLLLVGCVSK